MCRSALVLQQSLSQCKALKAEERHGQPPVVLLPFGFLPGFSFSLGGRVGFLWSFLLHRRMANTKARASYPSSLYT